MKLADLIKDIEGCRVEGDAGVEVRGLAYNASAVNPGDCFVAMRGVKADGHDFAAEAIRRGAAAVVSERPLSLPAGAAGVVVPASRLALARMSAAFFGDPSRHMALVGVTGTNGKTTTTYLLEAILRAAGMNPGVVGTVEYRYCGVTEQAPHTTPESIDLQRLLARMREKGADSCAMEVSSHALAQERVSGCHFDAAIFTNLTPEHLDYHSDMESYFEAKALLFEELLAKSGKRDAFAAINVDDPYGRDLKKRCPVPVRTYGLSRSADVSADGLSFDASGLSMRVRAPSGSFVCRSALCGKFNALNILGAAAVAEGMGIGLGAIEDAVSRVDVVPGRFESVANARGILTLVDYAHTPDALENALSNARELTSGRLIAVFGCGGDRDRAKRPLMGNAAGRLADVAIVTSDNPRTEEPSAIIGEILPGVREVSAPFDGERGYEVVEDRRAAIGRAVEIAREGDVVVVAGKGHEDYQIVGTTKLRFDDREVLKEFLEGGR